MNYPPFRVRLHLILYVATIFTIAIKVHEIVWRREGISHVWQYSRVVDVHVEEYMVRLISSYLDSH